MRKNIISCTTCSVPKPGINCEDCRGYSNWRPLVSEEEVKQIMESVKYDNVNHPAHYNVGNYESIDVMVATQGVEAVKNFCICNAFKYIYRHRFKNGVEDRRKAIWYLNKFVELEEESTISDKYYDEGCEEKEELND